MINIRPLKKLPESKNQIKIPKVTTNNSNNSSPDFLLLRIFLILSVILFFLTILTPIFSYEFFIIRANRIRIAEINIKPLT